MVWRYLPRRPSLRTGRHRLHDGYEVSGTALEISETEEKGFPFSEFRIRKHGFAPYGNAIGGKLYAAEKRAETVQIKAFSRRKDLFLSSGNNAEMGCFSLFHGLCFLMKNEP